MKISGSTTKPALLVAAVLAVFSLLIPQSPAPVSTVELGSVPPELKNVEWISGGGVRLGDLRDRSICVIDFFRSFYPPCLFRFAEEAAVQKKLGPDAVKFIGLSDEPAWQLRAFRGELPADFAWQAGIDLKDANFKAYLGLDAGAPLPPPFNFFAMPATLILDKTGRAVYFGSAPENIGAICEQVAAGTWDVERERKFREDDRRLDTLSAEVKAIPSGQSKRIAAVAEQLIALEIRGSKANIRLSAILAAGQKLLEDETAGGAYDKQILKCARLAVALNYFAPYELLASALFRQGEWKEAAVTLKKAADIVGSADIKERLRKRLAEYAAVLEKKTGERFDIGAAPAAASKTPADESAAPPSTLTGAEAAADMEFLHRVLQNGYAGFDEADWRLRRAGSSWQERLGAFSEKAAAKAAWTIDEFFTLAADFLKPVLDEHFYIALPKAEGTGFARRQKFTMRHDAYFTGLRLVEEGRRIVVKSADAALREYIGCEVRGLAPAKVETAALDSPALFPTVPESPKSREYLLGIFLTEPPKEPRKFVFFSKDGKQVEASLPLHRCRIKDPDAGKGDDWKLLAAGEAPLPVLRVRTAVADKFSADFLKTVDTLRDKPAAVLDLRANLGGSDTIAMNWIGLLRPGDYWIGGGNSIIAGGKGSVVRRWNPLSPGQPFSMKGPQDARPPDRPFRGRLIVVTDVNTASSGETFAGLARQIPGAVLAGENSRGCTLYGNADIIKRLPASRVVVRFGNTRFNWAGVFPIRESIGFFPDYWIDEADPYPVLARLASILEKEKGRE